MEEVIELVGVQSGPTSMILVGVHGDEKCGIEALEKILPTLQIERGRVLVAYGNPRAIEQNVRFTEANLNRMFKPDDQLSESDRKSYEYERAQYLKKYLDQTEALLDVHASFTPGSRRFVIGEENAKGIIQFLPFDLVITGITDVQPGGTDDCMDKQGKPGICVECGFLGDPASTEIAEQAILAFLLARGHISGDISITPQSYIHAYLQYFTQTSNFVLTKQFSDFEEIEANQLIGVDGDKEVRASKDSVILFARNREQVGDEAFVLAEHIKSPA